MEWWKKLKKIEVEDRRDSSMEMEQDNFCVFPRGSHGVLLEALTTQEENDASVGFWILFFQVFATIILYYIILYCIKTRFRPEEKKSSLGQVAYSYFLIIGFRSAILLD